MLIRFTDNDRAASSIDDYTNRVPDYYISFDRGEFPLSIVPRKNMSNEVHNAQNMVLRLRRSRVRHLRPRLRNLRQIILYKHRRLRLLRCVGMPCFAPARVANANIPSLKGSVDIHRLSYTDNQCTNY